MYTSQLVAGTVYTFARDKFPTVYTSGPKVYTVEVFLVAKAYTVKGLPERVYTVGKVFDTEVYMVGRSLYAAPVVWACCGARAEACSPSIAAPAFACPLVACEQRVPLAVDIVSLSR